MNYDAAVAGAGPAGLFAALAAARGGARVLLCDRMKTPALKLLVSGSGQCNLTHEGSVQELLLRYGGAGKFLRPALHAFSNADLLEYFDGLGVPTEIVEGGKAFPRSRRARDLLDALLADARDAGVEIRTGFRVRAAAAEDGCFRIAGEDASAGEERVRAFILATGGASYPKTGSSGDGYGIARGLGHRIVEPRPALAPVVSGAYGESPFASCAGHALRDARIVAMRAGRKAAEGRGDVLFTHRGLSGPGILDLSRDLRPGDEVRVSLAPGGGSLPEVEARLLEELGRHGARTAARTLQGFGLAESLARTLLKALGITEGQRASDLSRTARRALAQALAGGGDSGFPFPVKALGSWDEAMATAGGVALDEVDPKTMESRLVPGLYFAGEILDYDGDSGGFNIQAACSTGRLAGASAARRLGG